MAEEAALPYDPADYYALVSDGAHTFTLPGAYAAEAAERARKRGSRDDGWLTDSALDYRSRTSSIVFVWTEDPAGRCVCSSLWSTNAVPASREKFIHAAAVAGFAVDHAWGAGTWHAGTAAQRAEAAEAWLDGREAAAVSMFTSHAAFAALTDAAKQTSATRTWDIDGLNAAVTATLSKLPAPSPNHPSAKRTGKHLAVLHRIERGDDIPADLTTALETVSRNRTPEEAADVLAALARRALRER